MSNGRLQKLIDAGNYYEAARYAKGLAEREPPVTNRRRSNQPYWRWLAWLQEHTVEEIAAYMADPDNRKER